MTDQTGGGWQPDPTGRHQLRWHDGTGWTDQVADGGVTATDPVDAAGAPPVAPVTAAAPPSGGGRSKLPIILGAVVVVVLVGAAVVLLGGGDDGPSDEELEEIADTVLEDLDLPGDSFEGELDFFSLECHAETAGVDEDDVVIEQVGTAGGEDFDDAFLSATVAITILRDAGSGQRLLDAYVEDDTLECIVDDQDFGEDFELEVDEEDPVDIDGTPARVFEFDGGFQEVVLPVGRLLVHVQVSADDDDDRDETVIDVLTQAKELLQEAGV